MCNQIEKQSNIKIRSVREKNYNQIEKQWIRLLGLERRELNYLEAINWEKATEDAFLETCAQHNYIVLFIHSGLIEFQRINNKRLKCRHKRKRAFEFLWAIYEMRWEEQGKVVFKCLRFCMCERGLKQNTSLAPSNETNAPQNNSSHNTYTCFLLWNQTYCNFYLFI